MKHLATMACVVAVLALAASAALAAPPLAGNYQSTDLGGSIPTGRYTEGWDAGGNAFTVGTTQNCDSWDGAALGAVWRYSCGTQLANSVIISDHVDGNGNGNRTYECTYSGGIFWLNGAGPWGAGDASYPGHFASYVEFETVQYVGGVAIASVTNVQTTAHFDNYPAVCMAFSISNGTRVGTTDLGNVLPANFPALLDATCGATRSLGAWWNMTALTISITSGCTTPTKRSTWGSLKAVYR